MTQTLSVSDAAGHLAEYVARVASQGDSFVLTQGGRAVAELRPLAAGRKLAELPALLASLPHLTPGEAADLEIDLESARSEMRSHGAGDPWES